MKRTNPNDALWEQEGDRSDLRPLNVAQGKKLLAALAVLLLATMALVILFGLPNGPEDVSFEYEALLKEVRYDAEGHVTSLLTTPIGLNCDELLIYVDRGSKAVTPTGRTAYKKLTAGTLLFVSVREGTGLLEGTPPSIEADVVMVKSID